MQLVRGSLGVAALVVAVAATSACGPAARPVPQTEALPEGTPTGWSRVSDPEAELSVVMPAGAERKTKGGGITWAVKESDVVYLVSSVARDPTQPAGDAMHEAAGGAAKGCEGELAEEKEVAAEGPITANMFLVKCPSGTVMIGVARATKLRLYLQVIASRGVDPGEQRAKTFVSSFRPGR